MSVWDDIEETADDIGDAVVDVVDAVGGGLGDIAEWTADALATAGEWAAGAAIDTVEWHLDATLDAGDTFLTALDDSGMFDAIDTVTVGLIDIQYDDSGFSFNYGIEDVFGFGVKVGEGGVGADFDTVFSSYEASVGEDGVRVGGSSGIDFGPFPYYGGHASVDEDADLGVGGEGHLYLPTPVGMAGGELAGDYQETDDGYVVSGSVTGGYYAPTGTYTKGGVHASYEEDADGYRSNVGLHGEVGQTGGGSIKSSIDYTEGRQGDVSYEGVSVRGEVGAMGMSAGGELGYQHVETRDGEYDVVSGDIFGEAGGQRLTVGGAIIAGPDGVEVEGDLDFEADPLGAVNMAAGYAGVGEGSLPDGIGPIPDVSGSDDIAGGQGNPGTSVAAGAGGDTLVDSVGDHGDHAESAVDDLAASFGDAVDDAVSAPPDDFAE